MTEKAYVTAEERRKLQESGDTMPDGSYPVANQEQLDNAWMLRGHSKSHSEAEVVAHIRRQADKHGLKMPGEKQVAASKTAPSKTEPHGFQWPSGLPACAVCDRPATDSVHVNPNYGSYGSMFAHRGFVPSSGMQSALDNTSKRGTKMPHRSHPYQPPMPSIVQSVTCERCGQKLNNGIHVAGMPATTPSSSNSGLYGTGMPESVIASEQHEVAFVGEIGGKLVFASRASTGVDTASLPREIASSWRQLADSNPNNLWIQGRYVEADRPNRNSAFWSTADLEVGQPSVTHGPINWLHDEKRIIGNIAASELVRVEREAAASSGVGNHIVALGAIYSYIYPQEARIIEKASDDGKLWYSMECVSREVACLLCDRTLTYSDYMQQASRCSHMHSGAPRRFKEPTFGGGAVIVPPIRPGWINADARVVLPQAAALAERQAAAFSGMSTSDAEVLVAQLMIAYQGE